MAAEVNRRPHREHFFAAFGFGPFQCYFCAQPVEFGEVHVHHMNRDRTCNHPYNLVPAHEMCHRGFHKGPKHTEESKARIGAAARERRIGQKMSPETKAKIAASLRGRRRKGE